jgi:uncharacterized phage infection (PIP) family protein YhgE
MKVEEEELIEDIDNAVKELRDQQKRTEQMDKAMQTSFAFLKKYTETYKAAQALTAGYRKVIDGIHAYEELGQKARNWSEFYTEWQGLCDEILKNYEKMTREKNEGRQVQLAKQLDAMLDREADFFKRGIKKDDKLKELAGKIEALAAAIKV